MDCKQGDYTFHNFVSYIQEAAFDATHPVISHEALATTRREIQQGVNTKHKRPPSDKKRDSDVSFGTAFTTSAGNDENTGNRSSPNKNKCFLCLKPHELEHCQEFLKKPVTERKAFAGAKGLCFACLARGHMTRQCEQKKRCRICKKPHVTALHLYEPVTPKKDEQLEGSNEEETTKATSSCMSICHANNCDTCFITNDTCEKLGLTGPEVALQLGTMHAVENNTMKINGLLFLATTSWSTLSFRNYIPEIKFLPERNKFCNLKLRKPGSTFVQLRTRFPCTIRTSRLVYSLATIAFKRSSLAS